MRSHLQPPTICPVSTAATIAFSARFVGRPPFHDQRPLAEPSNSGFNKWVLNETKAPLFFLKTQLFIAVLLSLIADALGLLPDRLTLNIKVCRGLVPIVGLSVLGLSLCNYTLKYVHASVSQDARGLVLPFTAGVSGVVLPTRPSLRILFACGIVPISFFCSIFLDRIPMSMMGVGFGVASSTITTTHSVLIKQNLEIVNKSTILPLWCTHLLSIFVLVLIIFFVEGTEVMKLLFDADELLCEPRTMSALRTFVVPSSSLASLFAIKVTSPITHMVSSAVRGVTAAILGIWLFQDVISGYHVEAEASKADGGAAYERVPMNDLERGQGKQQPE
ncbi:hypothetical protein K438DRAFT_2178244 [Mycena galopus ATCC 62051]|nr:hypothetical protein K438DRAFT_2178244 [Mycena galopus ATCC 62051]